MALLFTNAGPSRGVRRHLLIMPWWAGCRELGWQFSLLAVSLSDLGASFKDKESTQATAYEIFSSINYFHH